MVNYYQILGVDSLSNLEEIKKAYKKMSLKWHPDRWVVGTEEEKSESEKKFKEINKSYQVLSDLELRKVYDNYGEDWEKMAGIMEDEEENPVKQKIDQTVVSIIKKFEICWQVTEEDLEKDSHAWEGFNDWREKVRNLGSIKELNLFRKQMISLIEKKKIEKQNILTKLEAIERIKGKLKRSGLLTSDLETDKQSYEEEITNVDDEEIHWKVDYIERKIIESINKAISNKSVKNASEKKQSFNWSWSRSIEDESEKLFLQDYLNKKYGGRSKKEKLRKIIVDGNGNSYSDKNTLEKKELESVDGGNLDLSEYPNLEVIIVDGNLLRSRLINLNLSSCSKLTILGISRNQLTSLDLTNCSKLKKIWCADNYLTELKIGDCLDLEEFCCQDNDLTVLNYPVSEKLTVLNISSNNFSLQDLSVFSGFTNLNSLSIGNLDQEKREKGIYNRWYGSLKSLENLGKLASLDVSHTNIVDDLNYLPNSLKELYCDNCHHLVSLLRDYAYYYSNNPSRLFYDVSKWRKNDEKRKNSEELKEDLNKENNSATKNEQQKKEFNDYVEIPHK